MFQKQFQTCSINCFKLVPELVSTLFQNLFQTCSINCLQLVPEPVLNLVQNLFTTCSLTFFNVCSNKTIIPCFLVITCSKTGLTGSPAGEHDNAEDHVEARGRRLVWEHCRAGTQTHEERPGEQSQANYLSSWGAALQRGSILASQPSAPGSILGVPENLFCCCWDSLTVLVRWGSTEAW